MDDAEPVDQEVAGASGIKRSREETDDIADGEEDDRVDISQVEAIGARRIEVARQLLAARADRGRALLPLGTVEWRAKHAAREGDRGEFHRRQRPYDDRRRRDWDDRDRRDGGDRRRRDSRSPSRRRSR